MKTETKAEAEARMDAKLDELDEKEAAASQRFNIEEAIFDASKLRQYTIQRGAQAGAVVDYKLLSAVEWSRVTAENRGKSMEEVLVQLVYACLRDTVPGVTVDKVRRMSPGLFSELSEMLTAEMGFQPPQTK